MIYVLLFFVSEHALIDLLQSPFLSIHRNSDGDQFNDSRLLDNLQNHVCAIVCDTFCAI